MRLVWCRAYSGGAACGLTAQSPALRSKLSGRPGACSAAGKLRYPAAVGAARSCRAAAAGGEARRRRDGPPGQAFEGKRPIRPVNRAKRRKKERAARTARAYRILFLLWSASGRPPVDPARLFAARFGQMARGVSGVRQSACPAVCAALCGKRPFCLWQRRGHHLVRVSRTLPTICRCSSASPSMTSGVYAGLKGSSTTALPRRVKRLSVASSSP